MSARGRLDLGGCIEVIGRLEGLAGSRGALVGRLRRLRGFLSDLPDGEAVFPLLGAAVVVNPGDRDPVMAFREFRRTVADFAVGHGIDLVLVVDGQKRADHAVRVWWMEGTDPTDRRLSDLSAAAASAAGPDELLVHAFGRPERDGRTVVRIFFDVAPVEAEEASRFVERLLTRLDSDVRFGFEEIPTARAGDEDLEVTRLGALAEADLVVILLSPEYLRWRTTEVGRADDALTVAPGRVAPVAWSDPGGEGGLGPYGSRRVFGAESLPDGAGNEVGGLERLSGEDLDRELVALHASLIEIVAPPPVGAGHMLVNVLGAAVGEPMQELARLLAQADEPFPVTIRAVPTRLDKRPGPASAAVVEVGLAPGGPTVEVVEHLVSWAMAPGGRPYFVVFGEYGMGKTVATQTLTRRLLAAREADASVPLPIYFDLRVLSTEVRKHEATLEEILADLIKRAWRTGRTNGSVTPEDVVNAVQSRRGLVIFDGLDEVLVHMSELQGQAFLRELLRILPPHLTSQGEAGGGGKVVLTCRTHFFRTLRDQHNFFRGQDRDVPQELYEALHLLPFTETQVRAYLQARQSPAGIEKAVALIRSVHDLTGLASRPYNLRLISEQLERLERRVAQGGTIDAAGLYEELVQSWMERDSGKHQFERHHKVRLMEDLAAVLWERQARRVGVVELETWLRERLLTDQGLHTWVELARPDPTVLAEDLRTATFIVRPDTDQFEFAHTSLLEYFLARYLHRTMTAGHTDAWQIRNVSVETLDFLIEIAAAADDAGDFIRHLTACGDTYQERVSEQVVRYALRAVDKGRPAPSLRRFQLVSARLRGLRVSPPPGTTIDMTGCNLAGADLRDANLQHVRLDHVDLTGACLDRAELHYCSLLEANMDRMSLHGAVVRAARLHGARLQHAVGDDSQWLWCEGEPAIGAVAGGRLAPAPPQQLKGSTAPHLEVLNGPSPEIKGMDWSPDSSRIAVADADSVKIWNPVSGSRQASLSHAGSSGTVAWSPDGKHVATGGFGGVRVWQVADPEAPPAVMDSGADKVHDLAWSPDGALLAAVDDGGVRVWDVTADPDTAAIVVTADGGYGVKVGWSPNGSRLATGESDGQVRLWDVTHPGAAPVVLGGPEGPPFTPETGPDLDGWMGWPSTGTTALAWSPDGRRIATTDGPGVRLWEATDPEATPLLINYDPSHIWEAVAWSPDGNQLAACGFGELRLWAVGDPHVDPVVFREFGGVHDAVAWSPDGTRFAAGGPGGLWLWDAADLGAAPVTYPADLGSWIAAAWSPDGNRIAAGGPRGVLVWEITRPHDARTVIADDRGRWSQIAWSPDGNRLAASGPGVVYVWEDAHQAARVLLTTEGTATGWNVPVAWSPDGSRLATGGDDALRLWDMAHPDAIPVVPSGDTGGVHAVAWSQDGTRLAALVRNRGLLLWRATEVDAGPLAVGGNTDRLQAIAWSPDSSRLAAAAEHGEVWLWATAHPEAPPVVLSSESMWVYAPKWSPDGSRLVAHAHGQVVMWQVGDPEAAPTYLASSNNVTWSPDGTHLTTSSPDGGMRLWDVANPEAPVTVGMTGSARTMEGSPDGSRIAAVGFDGVKLWAVGAEPRAEYTIHQFEDGGWCVLDPNNRAIHCHGDVWRQLRWRHRDPATGTSVLLPAEHFGPLPGLSAPAHGRPAAPPRPLPD